MSEHRAVFFDEEILDYGRERGTYKENGQDTGNGSEEEKGSKNRLLREASQSPELKKVADYVAASFANPSHVIHVFGEIEGAFLRFRGALPYRDGTREDDEAWAKNPGMALLVREADTGSMLACENRDTVIEMLLELAGAAETAEMQSTEPAEMQSTETVEKRVLEASTLELEMDARDLLCLLASWDVVRENRFEGGWFTATSVLNAFDLWEDKDFSRICGPIGDVASDEIFKVIAKADVENSLKGLAGEGILVQDEIDGTRLYSFSMKYRNLYKIFETASNRLAMTSFKLDGSVLILYVIRNASGLWAFLLENGVGKVQRLSRTSLEELLTKQLGLGGVKKVKCATMP